MATLKTFEKQPRDSMDYDIDYFEEWLTDLGDVGASVEVEAETGITIDAFYLLNGVVKVWTSGGTAGNRYKITIRLTTTNNPPRVKEVEITIKVLET